MLDETPLRAPAVQDILTQPEWFFQDYNDVTRKLRFVRASRDVLANQPFLAEGLWNYAALEKREVTESEILALLPAASRKPRINFIWHTAFCCSTVIARMLDRAGTNLSLKEPGVLMMLADAKRQRAIGPGQTFSNRIAELIFHLLGRPFGQSEQVTVKPTNASNCIQRDALAMTEGRHLFVYSDCRSFLISIAKKKESGRRYARLLYQTIAGDGNAQVRLSMDEVLALSDLQIAALAWHMQIAEIRRSWLGIASGRAVSLDCDAFLAAPLEALVKIDAHLGLGLGRDALEEAISGPAFSRHSKGTGTAFGAANRRTEHAETAAQLGRDLDEIVAWSYKLCETTPRGAPLPNPLIAVEKAYHP
jgi:hypothetical protein